MRRPANSWALAYCVPLVDGMATTRNDRSSSATRSPETPRLIGDFEGKISVESLDKGILSPFAVFRVVLCGGPVQENRFPGLDCSRVEPTQNITLVDPPRYVEDILNYNNKGSGLLQF